MELTIKVTVEDENVLVLAKYQAAMLDATDRDGNKIVLNLDAYLQNVVGNEIYRLAKATYDKKEDLTKRYAVMADQIKEEVGM